MRAASIRFCVRMLKNRKEKQMMMVSDIPRSSSQERQYSDAEAVLGIAKATPYGNAAYNEVFRHYYEPLVFFASEILKNREEAEDIVSDVLGMRFYANCPQLAASAEAGELQLQAWFYKVTRNLCFNKRRDYQRRSNTLDQATKSHDRALYSVLSSSFENDASDAVYRRETSERMEDAMNGLSKNHKDVLFLRYRDDMSYREIATALSINIGTVMSRLSRAKHRLLEVAPDLEELLAA